MSISSIRDGNVGRKERKGGYGFRGREWRGGGWGRGRGRGMIIVGYGSGVRGIKGGNLDVLVANLCHVLERKGHSCGQVNS